MRGVTSSYSEEQHLQSAECWLKTQAACRTFQPNVDTFNANVVIGKRSVSLDCINDAIIRVAKEDETKHVIVSECETIQPMDNQKQLQGNKYAPTSKSKISVLPQGVDVKSNSSPQLGNEFADVRSKTSPDSERPTSRGMSGAKVEQTSAETLGFRCVRERCRLMRGEGATYVAHWKKSRKIAFTLAEVLITLGIIGVVAALTLPTLIQNHQKQVYVSQLKKSMSIVSNMFTKMQADEGVSDIGSIKLFTDGVCSLKISDSYSGNEPWQDPAANSNGCEDAYGNPSVFEELVPKYLKVVKMCRGRECDNAIKYQPTNLNCSNGKCMLSKSGSPQKLLYFSDRGTDEINIRGFYSNDGRIYYFHVYPVDSNASHGYKSIYVIVDVNGTKGPNMWNIDLFDFYISSNDSRIMPSVAVKHLMSNGWKMDY